MTAGSSEGRVGLISPPGAHQSENPGSRERFAAEPETAFAAVDGAAATAPVER